jgi:large repetitive protein
VRTGSSASAKEEWVELYNPCGNAVTLTGKLVYRSDTNNGATDTSTLATITSKSIAAGGYFLIANSGYTGAADISPFDSTSVGMADGGGGVGLRDGSNTLLTSMGWGTANDTFQQGSAAAAEASGKSIARQPNATSTHHDNLDFASSTPTPGAAN